jgi:hypothetical protein
MEAHPGLAKALIIIIKLLLAKALSFQTRWLCLEWFHVDEACTDVENTLCAALQTHCVVGDVAVAV